MKKVIFTLVLQVLVSLSIAQAQGSVLNLSMNGNYLFTVQIDNQYINNPDRRFTIQNLAPGNHYLRIYKMRPVHGLREVYNGYVNVPFNSSVNAVLERSNNLRITGIIAHQPVCVDPYVYEQPYFPPVYQNVITPVCDAEFNDMVSTLNNITFDSSRLKLAKQIVSDKYLSTSQVIRLMNLFTFDSSRLEFAKFAYSRTVDKNRYFQTYNSFTFDSSANELSEYIARFS